MGFLASFSNISFGVLMGLIGFWLTNLALYKPLFVASSPISRTAVAGMGMASGLFIWTFDTWTSAPAFDFLILAT